LSIHVAQLQAVDVSKRSKSNGNIIFEDLNHGYYLITGEGTPSGTDVENVISRGMLINVPDEAGKAAVQIALKADSPTIDKEVWYHDEAETGNAYDGTTAPTDGNDAGWQDWTDVNIGDNVYFKLESTVPDMTGYEKYTYIVHDTMSKGLTFDPATADIQVRLSKAGGTDPITLAVGTDYTVTTSAFTDTDQPGYIGGTKLEIAFVNFELRNAYAGGTVEIIYKATLNEHALSGNPSNFNKVKLEYSNDPNWDGSGEEPTGGETPEDEIEVYTFEFEIFKYTGNFGNEHTALSGAEFQLSVKPSNSVLYFVPYAVDGYNYRIATDEEIASDADKLENEKRTTTKLVSDNNGKIKIKGLDAGTYVLKETKAPVGYNLLTEEKEIVIEKATSETGFKVSVGGTTVDVLNIQNNTGGQLPGTGGIGVQIFFGIGGAMAILLAVAFIFYRKRKILEELNIE